MRGLREHGTKLLFVSHDLATVQDIYQQALYSRKGKMEEFLGDSQEKPLPANTAKGGSRKPRLRPYRQRRRAKNKPHSRRCMIFVLASYGE
jgi:ABC-type oligopeptide transport system ATPase subunit